MKHRAAELPVLPQRRPGSHLPEGVRAVGVAKVPVLGDRWYVDERTLTELLVRLRRWEPAA